MSEEEQFEPHTPNAACDMRDAELEAACETYARESTRALFDELEESIVQYHTNLKTQLAKAIGSCDALRGQSAKRAELRGEIFRLRQVATGVAMLAQHVGYFSETRGHGTHRRRLAQLTVDDLALVDERTAVRS